MTFVEAYEACAVVLCAAMQKDADCRKANGMKAWSALLTAEDFHDRCYRMAKFAVYQDKPTLPLEGAEK